MDTNALVDLIHKVQGQPWVDKVNETHKLCRLCPWVSTFHPNKLPWNLEGAIHHGAFNAGLKMAFSDNTAWVVRFPCAGKSKVAMEVTALGLIRDRTAIPVPRVRAWGPAASNPLCLGPFRIMDFSNGVSLTDLLRDHNAERPSRLMREDISDHDVEIIYRQMAGIMLQLFKIDLDQMGSLPPPALTGAHCSNSLSRPLTFKAHNILQNGGVNTFVIGQDWEQLVHHPNSVCGEYDAQNKYVAFKALRSLVPDLIHPRYDHGKFKLICDELGLANLIVRSKDDLTIVGVIYLEWSYIGPAQLFGSAPWWLLQDRPVNSAWDYNGEEPPEIAASFPLTRLRQHFGADGWAKREKEFDCAEELEAFALQKVGEVDKYDEDLVKVEENKALMDSGRMTKEEFILTAAAIIESRSSSSSVLNDEVSRDKVRKAKPIS
ncbi:phosphotransferase family protein [Aspergillus vadensis CBS 113365]|uniref:Phosphotransferase enzyme family protein n=1 Tax=Aspergillus vadensis (strain CBS 113365 / IMI 142717 / IBT 24658) TaxID=1448311 RepID=A0A319BGD9_ASPVC|nr:phosphotransferase enzyme family protein [Aspergillus vadensis CBS 113365]PYH69880.1 phosphotransferase enzyme family protein [Aspergillus vadensis CBS 113365]